MTAGISVITPTKNRLTLLGEAVDSVQRQTFSDWEHIVVDDGSDDGTAEEMARRAAADPRIRYLRREGDKAGASVCRNQGVRMSRAEFIVFLDSDDLLESRCLERRVAVMRRNEDIDFATFRSKFFRRTVGDLTDELDPDLIGDDLVRFLLLECPWIITGPIWRKGSLERLGLFDESLPSWQDVDLHIRAITAGLRYLRFPEIDHFVRWQYEVTKVSIEQRRSPRHLSAAIGTIQGFERYVSGGPGMNWVRQRALCSLYFFIAEQWAALGNLSAALEAWQQIRERRFGSRALHVAGAGLILLQSSGGALGRLGNRVAHKWKGWARMRTNPELVAR